MAIDTEIDRYLNSTIALERSQCPDGCLWDGEMLRYAFVRDLLKTS
ncbi:hypothetical protein [Baaleninema simplex]|nr:hypothetical protein [Baaleninema simplex]